MVPEYLAPPFLCGALLTLCRFAIACLQAASMVPEYLTPANGGVLSPGQVCVVLRAALARYSSRAVTTFVLDIAEGPVGKVGGGVGWGQGKVGGGVGWAAQGRAE